MQNSNLPGLGVSLLIWLIFALAYVFPEPLWTVHFWVFLPAGWLLLAVALLCILLASQKSIAKLFSRQLNLSTRQEILILPSGVAALGGIVFSTFPLIIDPYGDAAYILPGLDAKVEQWSLELLEDFLSTNFLDPKVGGNSTAYLARFIAYFTGQRIADALISLNTFCGMLFLFLWFRLTSHILQNSTAKLISWIMGGAAPFLLMFSGHYEYYAPAYVCLLAFFYSYFRFCQTKRETYFYALFPLFLLAVKFHITSGLLVFPLGLMVWEKYDTGFSITFSWKRIGLVFFTFIMLVGLFLYFILLNSYDGPRAFTESSLEEALFLPLYTLEIEPLQRYNLLSWNHISDYLSLLLWWSPIAIMILLQGVSSKKLDKQDFWFKLSLISFVLFALAFFVLNPLLSMPIDWDLFSLPAIPFLLLALVVLKHMEKDGIPSVLVGSALAFGLMSVAVFGVNSNSSALSQRLAHLGDHTFKTYWIGTSTIIYNSLNLIENEDERQEELLIHIEELEDFAAKETDVEYADLLCQAGIYYFEQEGQDSIALSFFERAYSYKPNLSRNVYYLVLTHFQREEFSEAHNYARLLIGVRYPDFQKAYRIAIHVALEAEAYEDARAFCEEYLEIWPEDSFIKRVSNALVEGSEPEQVKYLFRQE